MLAYIFVLSGDSIQAPIHCFASRNSDISKMSIQGKEENTERVPHHLPMPDLNLTPEENELQTNSQRIIVYTRRARAVEEVIPVSDRNIRQRLDNEENNAEETNHSDVAVPQSPPSENVCPEVEKTTEEGGNEDAGNEDAHEDSSHEDLKLGGDSI